MATLTEFCKIEAKLRFTPVGATGTGFRVDVPFEGTATSSHWEGERKVAGTDVVRIGSDGVQQLEIRARIGEGGDMVAYQAIGRGYRRHRSAGTAGLRDSERRLGISQFGDRRRCRRHGRQQAQLDRLARLGLIEGPEPLRRCRPAPGTCSSDC